MTQALFRAADRPHPSPAEPRRAALTAEDGRMLRFGEPHRVLSGSLHYFRVHPEQWADRLQRLADLGLNTVDTYVPWNFHQRHADLSPDFAGWRDVERFIGLAGEVGLDVVVRPGPYICAEWSNGGFPAWLTGRGVALRSSDDAYIGEVRRWFSVLIPRLAALQSTRGGPIVAFQVENEFGSFGDDAGHLRLIDELLVEHGVEELRYTADGPTELMQDGGSLPGVLSTATLGSKPGEARELLAGRRPGSPFFVAEFWNGWFDHWGHAHHVRDADDAAATVAEAIADGGSISLYMAHGGTNFGLWAGANDVDGETRPTTTSYDSDAPIAEDGSFTDKFRSIRAALGAADRPPRSPSPARLAPRSVAAARIASGLVPSLELVADAPSAISATPPTFEQLGLDSGIVVYSAQVRLPSQPTFLTLTKVGDRAIVVLDGEVLGVVTGSGGVAVAGGARTAHLELVVENLGRINYGWRLGESKGLLGPVLVDRRAVQGWTARAVNLEDATPPEQRTPRDGADAAGWASAELVLDAPADAFIALPGFEKGFVWVNDFLLGRYWEIGPQRTLYVPAPLLRPGPNRFSILELHRMGDRLELREAPDLGPEEPYVEEF